MLVLIHNIHSGLNLINLSLINESYSILDNINAKDNISSNILSSSTNSAANSLLNISYSDLGV
jgi:hypothetical protein